MDKTFKPAKKAAPTGTDTAVVRIRKVMGKYTAYPKKLHVKKKHITNVIFVLENAPPDAELIKLTLAEYPPNTNHSNPFNLPGKNRVLLVVDDNRKKKNHHRYFEYSLKVLEKGIEHIVDPGIDNDPP